MQKSNKMIFRVNSVKLLLLKQDTKLALRHCSTQHGDKHECTQNVDNKSVRVRFAPSPTGYLHLGGLRTALINYLFAKAHNGTFIVRIEDTDQARTVPDAQQNFFRNLEWAGIKPDESVIHGGNFGPYVQSQRLEIYRQKVRQLLENGSAYYCFCTEKRLEMLRKEAQEANEIYKYDNRCRHLTPLQVAEKLANNDTFTIRFKLESEDVPEFNDLVFGETSIDVTDEGDPIIIKSDGYPTYHFANVVDDHLMKVTHVFRGSEWMVSTPKHLLLYSAFGWNPPKYGHLPLILNPDGTKLSKRHDHASVDYYRDRKIFPLALINYITLSGGGFRREVGAKIKNHTMEELAQLFDINKVNKASSRLNTGYLEECNRLELIRYIKDPILCDEVVKQTTELIKRTYPKDIDSLDLDAQHIRNVLNWSVNSDRLLSLQQLVEGDLSFLWILPKIQSDNVKSEWVEKLVTKLERGDFDKTHLLELLREFSKENNLKFPKFMASLRTMLSGVNYGVGVADMMEILGKTTTIKRISKKKDQKKPTK